MWSCERPRYGVTYVIEECTRGLNTPKSRGLKQVKAQLIQAATEYETALTQGSCWLLSRANFCSVDLQTMDSYYSGYLRDRSSGGRKIYDLLIANGRADRCVYCGEGEGDTLDHVLPISCYHMLGIEPINLVAACRTCNGLLHDDFPVSSDTETINPYFWADSKPWLSGRLIRGSHPYMEFEVNSASDWDRAASLRIVNLFGKLQLQRRYVTLSMNRVKIVSNSLLSFARSSDRPELRIADELHQRADHDQELLGPNHWFVVMQRVLSLDDWFLETWMPQWAKARPHSTRLNRQSPATQPARTGPQRAPASEDTDRSAAERSEALIL